MIMTAIEIPTPDPRTLDEPGQSFALALSGQYAIKRLIGRGGMGMVYLARDRRLQRLVAIKTLPPQLAADAAVRERFLRETRTAGSMSHPNIVPIYGADEIDGHVFFVMSYIEGDSLATHVRAQGRLDARDVVRYLRDVAAALAHAHQRGIIHRDIKAENILIERGSDRAMVTDFGIARFAEAAPLTATGQLLGTVYYVSPEQVSGDPVDARSDLYSLGVVGYLALSGRFPFDSELASAVLVSHVTKTPAPLASIAPEVPAALASIIDRCLAKSPAHRYASADDLLAALDVAAPEVERHAAGRPPLPRLVSDTEAHSIWQRAAELQAQTGIQPRPAIVPSARDHARDDARTSGFRVDDVRSAAAEAGIGNSYVEHAMAERGLTSPAKVRPPAATAGARAPQRRSIWAGIPLLLREHRVVDGEMHPRDFDRVINALRDSAGTMGTTTASSRELAWQCGWSDNAFIASVVPGRDHTTVDLLQDLRRRAMTTILGVMSLGGLGGFLLLASSPRLFHDRVAFPAWMLGVGVSYLVARVVNRWQRRSEEARSASTRGPSRRHRPRVDPPRGRAVIDTTPTAFDRQFAAFNGQFATFARQLAAFDWQSTCLNRQSTRLNRQSTCLNRQSTRLH